MTNAQLEPGSQSSAQVAVCRFLDRGRGASRFLPRSGFPIVRALRTGLLTGLLSAVMLSAPALIALGGEVAFIAARGTTSFSASDDGRLNEINRLIDAGDLTAARQMLADEVASRGDSYQTLFLEAKILFREGKYQESLEALERALSLNQRDAEVYKLVASNAILVNRMDIAEQALKSAAQLAPADSLIYFHLGALYYTDSRFPSALPVLEKSVTLNPDYVPAQLFLALTLEELDQEQSAVNCYRRAIELAERTGFRGEQPYLYLGRLLYRQNKLNESLPNLQRATRANPQSCEGWCLLSRIYSAQGQETDAVAALNQCIQADPKYSEAHYLLSRAYVKQGQTEAAAKELSLFQELRKTEQKKKDPRKNQRANQ
ncbi:MAG TPA: tetratricopeptide repeat protein [Terriglobia bacterium]|nr:tetratricopeptide repeat protein [Terriglobia bacterium]